VQLKRVKQELPLKTGELKEYRHGKANEIKKLKSDLENASEENV